MVIHSFMGMTEAAFRKVYEEYRGPLFRFAYRLTGSRDVAEDLAHDCFVSLFHGGFDERRGPLKTYLYAAMRNLARKHFRDSGREEQGGDLDTPMVDAGGAAVLEGMISRETAAAVQCAVDLLPLLQREAIVLFEYEDLALDEISKIVNADVGTVKSRLHRARENLRKSLAPAMKEAAQ